MTAYELQPDGTLREVADPPTRADLVQVVRCRNCEYAQVRHPLNPITGIPAGIEDWRCDYFWNVDELPEVEPDGFCAWGKRREDA